MGLFGKKNNREKTIRIYRKKNYPNQVKLKHVEVLLKILAKR